MCKTIPRLYSVFTVHNPEGDIPFKELLYTLALGHKELGSITLMAIELHLEFITKVGIHTSLYKE